MRPVTHNTKIKMVEPPAGYAGEGFFSMKMSEAVGLARSNSIWPSAVCHLLLWH
jgi:NADH-quinone oxidoreductase subunit B